MNADDLDWIQMNVDEFKYIEACVPIVHYYKISLKQE